MNAKSSIALYGYGLVWLACWSVVGVGGQIGLLFLAIYDTII